MLAPLIGCAAPAFCVLQPPEETCSSVNDMGKNITQPCGTWTTYYRKVLRGRKGWQPLEACSLQAACGVPLC